ncbi:hypothetical protein P152DRAFT_476603 [Eremomyces bilateralis CBS 781.70]|uniref:Uncharacterized protein n=1 Tax=Eremomyces bilateralis CBS 781.70 TaxID=1392243 RepID=A0A6G1FUB9_9PEZI|nr:uncharacterized protein P152DRAFT_476603 [Eremomyces bilateralis CBS 781.70]KAF1809251.1 hypothetical protein P152DRAFT_476603 [Eremomyces bilateralis CBS 781.70]
MRLFGSRRATDVAPSPTTATAQPHYTSPSPTSTSRRGFFGRRRRHSVSPPPTRNYDNTNGSIERRSMFARRHSLSPSPSRRGMFGRRRSTSSSWSPTRRAHGSNLLSRRHEDAGIVAARERVLGAEAAEREADRALVGVRAAVKEAREHVRRLEREAAEESRLAKIKRNQARSISKRAKPLGRHGHI